MTGGEAERDDRVQSAGAAEVGAPREQQERQQVTKRSGQRPEDSDRLRADQPRNQRRVAAHKRGRRRQEAFVAAVDRVVDMRNAKVEPQRAVERRSVDPPERQPVRQRRRGESRQQPPASLRAIRPASCRQPARAQQGQQREQARRVRQVAEAEEEASERRRETTGPRRVQPGKLRTPLPYLPAPPHQQRCHQQHQEQHLAQRL
jgi:hypothetical protein